MRPTSPTVTLLILTLLLPACSDLSRSVGEVGEVVTIEGTVQEIDVSPMAYDGPAVLRLSVAGHGRLTVYLQSCLGGCALEAVDQLPLIRAGDTWQVTGEVLDDGSLAVFQDSTHALLKLSD